MIKDNFNFHIVGAGRGGTSLLTGLLDYHSGLEVGFELFSAAYLVGRDLPYQGPKLFHKRVTAYISACKQKANKYPNVLWGNKITTEQIARLEDHNLANPESIIDILDRFFNHYLEGKAIIFVLRDGRACVNSKVKRLGRPIEKACKGWQYSVKCFKFFETCHDNNICIRFEDLLHNPEKTLTKICDFLKIPYQEEMLRGTNNKKMRPEYQKNKFDLSKIKSIDLADDGLKIIHDDLKYCGYL